MVLSNTLRKYSVFINWEDRDGKKLGLVLQSENTAD